MSEPHAFDYAVVRVVPRVERGEFVNAGVIVYSATADFLGARVELDAARLSALAPGTDCDEVRGNLEAIPRVCAGEDGPLQAMSRSERFHWLTAPRSTVIQTSPVHSGIHPDPRSALDQLFRKFVR